MRLKPCNKGQIYQRQSDLAISGGVYSHAYAKFHENKTLAKNSEFTVYGISYWNFTGIKTTACYIVWPMVRMPHTARNLTRLQYYILCGYLPNVYIIEASLSWIFRFLQPFTASWMTQILLTDAKLTCPCNTLRTSNSFARSDTGVVIDSEQHQSRMCKTSLLFAPLAVHVHTGCSAFLFTLRQNH